MLEHGAEDPGRDGGGHPVEHGRDRVRVVERRLGPPAAGDRAQACHPHDGIGDVRRNGEPDRGEVVAAQVVALVAEADRHREAQLVDGDVVALVVAAEPLDHRGEERVVRAPAGGLRRGFEVGERDVDRVEPSAEAPVGEDGRGRFGDRRHEARQRNGHVHGAPRGAQRVADGRHRGAGRRTWQCQACLERRGGQARQRRAEVGQPVHRRRLRWIRQLGVDGVPLLVDHRERQFDAADAVGERVVDLLDEGCPTSFHPFDERELPQRAGPIERIDRQRLGEVEHVAEAPRRWHPGPSQVVRQVEPGVHHPPGTADPAGRHDHPLPEAGDDPRGVVDPLHEAIPVGRPIEERHGRDRRTQHRVLLDVPQHGVRRLHVVREPPGERGVVIDEHLPMIRLGVRRGKGRRSLVSLVAGGRPPSISRRCTRPGATRPTSGRRPRWSTPGPRSSWPWGARRGR